MHIKLAPVVRYCRKIQSFKATRVILKQEPCEFVWQHREDCIVTQWTSIPVLDLAVIKCIVTAILASAPNQSVHHMPSYLQQAIMYISDIRDITRINKLIAMNADLGPLPYIEFNTQTRACIVGGDHGRHCLVPKAIRRQCSATGVLPNVSSLF